VTQTPSQPCQPLHHDGRYGFHPPTPIQQVLPSSPTYPRASPRMSHPPPHTSPVSSPTLPPQVPHQPAPFSAPDPSDSEDEEEAPDLEPEVDEQSNDEDDRQAHMFLQSSSDQTMVTIPQTPPSATSVVVAAAASPPLPTGQGHLGFAVSVIQPIGNLLSVDNRIGPWH